MDDNPSYLTVKLLPSGYHYVLMRYDVRAEEYIAVESHPAVSRDVAEIKARQRAEKLGLEYR